MYPTTGTGADPLYAEFSTVASANGQIDATELQARLSNGMIRKFSLQTAALLIKTLDRDYSGQMGFTEYKELMSVLNQWENSFRSFDKNSTGYIEPTELQTALFSFGYNLSSQVYSLIQGKFNLISGGLITLDGFIQICITVRLLTNHFRARDTTQTGQATMSYDDFIQIVFCAI